jgi:hypothetical protein
MSIPDPLRDSIVVTCQFLSSFWRIVDESSQTECPIVDLVPTLHGSFVMCSIDSGEDRLECCINH